MTPVLAVWLAVIAPAAVAEDVGCPTGDDTEIVRVDVSVDPTIVVASRSQERRLAAPHVATVRVTVVNPGDRTLSLTFPNPCFLGYRVETKDGAAVPADDGGVVCAQAIHRMQLPARGRETKEFRWTARTWDGEYRPLAAGDYRIVGTLAKRYCGTGTGRREQPPVETPPVAVEVRPAN